MLKNLDQLFMTYKFSPIPIASDATSTEHLSEGSLNLYACSILVAEIKQGWRRMTQIKPWHSSFKIYADQCFLTWWETSVNNGTFLFTVLFNLPSNLIQIPLGKCHNTISWLDLFKTSTFKSIIKLRKYQNIVSQWLLV